VEFPGGAWGREVQLILKLGIVVISNQASQGPNPGMGNKARSWDKIHQENHPRELSRI